MHISPSSEPLMPIAIADNEPIIQLYPETILILLTNRTSAGWDFPIQAVAAFMRFSLSSDTTSYSVLSRDHTLTVGLRHDSVSARSEIVYSSSF